MSKTLQIEFTEEEAFQVMCLIAWARRQTYAQLTDHAVSHGYGEIMQSAAGKMAEATGYPDWRKAL